MNRADSLQSINHMVLNRVPLKSTPVNMPPLPAQFSKRMLSSNENSDPHPEVTNLLKPPINLTNELNRIEISSSTTTVKPSTTTTNTAKPFYVTSKPMSIKSTPRPAVKLMKAQETVTKSTLKPNTTRPAIARSTYGSPVIASILSRPLSAPLIKNQRNSSHVRNVNLVNDNLVADEHYIVNNLTSIGLMDENFKPENLVEPETSAESSRLNSERATAMNAVLNELSGTSRTETEVNVGFIILQLSNHAPEFPLVKPNFTSNNDLLFIVFGQIEENAKPNSLVQLEQELLITDQDHGLNGTFDVQLVDSTKTFDIQPKTGYRNQTFQLQLVDSNQLRQLENKQVNLKVGYIDRVFFLLFFYPKKR